MTALVFGGVVLSLSVGSAAAAPSQRDNTLCSTESLDDPNHIDFYLPGEGVPMTGYGRLMVCQDDGSWDDGGPLEDPHPYPHGPL